MSRNIQPTLTSDVHFRVPADFMEKVHSTARSKGMTASSFMRSAIVDAMQRTSGDEQVANPGIADHSKAEGGGR